MVAAGGVGGRSSIEAGSDQVVRGALGRPAALQTKQPSRAMLIKKLNEEEDEPWAEVAKFNQLLEMKIKLDEASEQKRKANMQRAYLDQ